VADPVMIPDVGLQYKLGHLRTAVFEVLTIRLYKVDKVPAAGDVLADYDAIQADFSGYAGQNMSGWAPPILAGGIASIQPGTYSWGHNGGAVANTIYGWYAHSPDGVLVMASKRLAGPIVLSGAGQFYSVDVVATDQRAA